MKNLSIALHVAKRKSGRTANLLCYVVQNGLDDFAIVNDFPSAGVLVATYRNGVSVGHDAIQATIHLNAGANRDEFPLVLKITDDHGRILQTIYLNRKDLNGQVLNHVAAQWLDRECK